MNCRNQFTFYKSFDDVIEDMSDEQVAEYTRTLLDVQFLRVKIEDVVFNDPMLNIVWKSQKHSIESSIKGYLDSQKREKCKEPYLGVYDPSFTPYGNPYDGVRQQDKGKEQGEGKVKGEDKEQVKEKEVVQISQSQLEADDVALYLFEKIRSVKPDFKEPNLTIWAKSIELAIRLDGRDKKKLIGCIDWIYYGGGDFWIPNIMSGKKLREQFDKMEMQAAKISNNSTEMAVAQFYANKQGEAS